MSSLDLSQATQAKVQTNQRSTPCQLLATVLAFRHSSRIVENIPLLNSKGKVTTYHCIPMYIIEPYSSGLNATRTIWVAVNGRAELSITNKGESVYRNTAKGVFDMFQSLKIDGKANSFNALLASDCQFRDVHLPALDVPNTVTTQAYEILMKAISEIEATITDEELAKDATKQAFEQYQEIRKKVIAKGLLRRSQVFLTENIVPVYALSPASQSATNPWGDLKGLAERFKFTYCPTVNSVNGFIVTNTSSAPDETGLNIGRNSLTNTEKGMHATSTMATAQDSQGHQTAIIATVMDTAFNTGKEDARTRSMVFEEVTETPTEMFVQGQVQTFVATVGNNSARNGHSFVGVRINSYTQNANPSNGLSLHSNAIDSIPDSLEAMLASLNEESINEQTILDETVESENYNSAEII
jgi:hypothetical protein